MSELRRLRDVHEDDVFGAALRAADRDAPTRDAEAKLLASLGVTAAVIAAASPPAATVGGASIAAKASGSALLTKLLVGSALVLSGSIGVVLVTGSSPSATEAHVPSEAPILSPSAFTPPPATPVAPPLVAPEREEAPTALPRLPSARTAPKPAALTETPPSAPPVAQPAAANARSIAPELKEVERARTLLASGHASEALAVVNAYQEAFPDGALTQEAVAVRLDALIRLGQRSVAEAEAREFLARHPESPQAPRIRALLLRR